MLIFDEDAEDQARSVAKLLRAIAKSSDAQMHHHDVIFDKAADLLIGFVGVIQEQEIVIGSLARKVVHSEVSHSCPCGPGEDSCPTPDGRPACSPSSSDRAVAK